MKRVINTLLALLLAAILPATVLLSSAALPAVYSETYYAELPELYRRLREADGQRIIIVGNSDVAFGVNGELLEKLLSQKGFNYTVCPFGLYGAVGTSAMLELSRPELREGDIVVLVAEPLSDVLSTYFGATAYLKCAETDLDLVKPLTRDMQKALFGNLVPYMQERAELSRSGEKPFSGDVYAKSSFNSRCDMVYPRPGNIMTLGYDTATPLDLASVTVEDAFADEVRDYIGEASEAGAQVLLSFSPMNASAVTDFSDEAVYAYFDLINRAFPCPVISNPNDYILESGWFYDSNLHLNDAGCTLRTELLAEDLLVWLGCYTELEYDAPEMPEPVRAAAEETEGDADAFIFEEISGGAGLTVSGLTEKGLEAESLTVPAYVDSKPVVGIASDALRGADRLTELTLPATIESLPAGLFEGTMVKRLVFSDRSTLPVIDAETFRGADDLRVLVTSEDWPIFRDGLGCAVNPWEGEMERVTKY